MSNDIPSTASTTYPSSSSTCSITNATCNSNVKCSTVSSSSSPLSNCEVATVAPIVTGGNDFTSTNSPEMYLCTQSPEFQTSGDCVSSTATSASGESEDSDDESVSDVDQ